MKSTFISSRPYVFLALNKRNITFPTTKNRILTMAGNEEINIGLGRSVSFANYCKHIKMEFFPTQATFLNALAGLHS